MSNLVIKEIISKQVSSEATLVEWENMENHPMLLETINTGLHNVDAFKEDWHTVNSYTMFGPRDGIYRAIASIKLNSSDIVWIQCWWTWALDFQYAIIVSADADNFLSSDDVIDTVLVRCGIVPMFGEDVWQIWQTTEQTHAWELFAEQGRESMRKFKLLAYPQN